MKQSTLETRDLPKTGTFENYELAYDNLIKAQEALNSPCVEEAAWAIHDGTEENNVEVINQAKKILEDYTNALNYYKLVSKLA